MLKENISLHINEQELPRLPKNRPFLCIANQLINEVDSLVFDRIFENVTANWEIISIKKSKTDKQTNFYKRLYKILKTKLEKGTSVVISINFSINRLDDLGKRGHLNRLMKVIKKLGFPIVPVRLHSNLPVIFHQPAIQKRFQNSMAITVRIGNPIETKIQDYFEKNSQFRKFIQSKIFALGTSLEVKKFFRNPFSQKTERQEDLEAAIPQESIQQDIQNLTFENLIASQSEYDIFVARASEIPNVLLEIGRLREVTFRSVGEGTGKSRDLDEFDLYYRQLIIWDREAKKIVGGYRIGEGDLIFERYGVEGFYLNSVFKIGDGFFPFMKSGVELGRSYIVPEYQKKRWPLFLLWRGILFFILKNPQYQYLYGPVSISKYYSNVSKSLIVAFIKKFYYNEHLAQYLKPRKPFKVDTKKVDIDLLLENMGNETKNLDSLVEDIEPEHFRIPVLIRQYLKLNARFVSFNVDPNFSDCLDGFIILNLKDVPYSMLEKLRNS